MPSPKISKLISQLSRWPSIGPKSAERLVYHLLYRPKLELDELIKSLSNIKEGVITCSLCFNFAENSPCEICSDNNRNSETVCVVCKPQDIQAIEKTKSFKGVYHLLGGNINPLENKNFNSIRLNELIRKVKDNKIKEIILALNPDMAGETTALYLIKILKAYPDIKISRLARGLPMGADVEYADEITLEKALENREVIN